MSQVGSDPSDQPIGGGVRPRVAPVIMSGGSGTRLWPLSTEDRPKQFHALASSATLLQDTVARMAGDDEIAFLPPLIVCNHRHAELVSEQLSALGVAPSAVVLEPFGRNTAAVAVIAARLMAERDPDALILLLPADHVMTRPDAFRAAVKRAATVAHDRIVAFGVHPDRPETDYGYIRRGEALAPGVFRIARFVEKPPREAAEGLLAEGGHLWNGGMFMFSARTMLSETAAHRPDIASTVGAAFEAAERRGPLLYLDPVTFAACPSESLDVAVMQPTRLGAVVPLDAGWADVGSWSELWRLGPHDADGNLVRGDAVVLDTEGSLVLTEDAVVAVVGMEEVIVVASGGAVLVLPKSRAREVKRLVDAVRALRERKLAGAHGGSA